MSSQLSKLNVKYVVVYMDYFLLFDVVFLCVSATVTQFTFDILHFLYRYVMLYLNDLKWYYCRNYET